MGFFCPAICNSYFAKRDDAPLKRVPRSIAVSLHQNGPVTSLSPDLLWPLGNAPGLRNVENEHAARTKRAVDAPKHPVERVGTVSLIEAIVQALSD
jgi:hypothetical protein